MNSRRASHPEPEMPHEEFAKQAKFAKPQYGREPEATDTSSLTHRKIHPNRDEAYRRWLNGQPCAIKGKTDERTGQPHICWSPEMRGPREYVSDAAHGGKAYSGKLKRDDSGCIPLCRHAHRLQENNMDSFDRRFGIDRHAIAEKLYAEFRDEQERKGLR